MSQKHNSIGRIIHRSLEELKTTYDVAQAISWRAAWVTLRAKVDIQIMNRNGFREPENVRNRLLRKHKIMLDFLEDKFKGYWESYQRPTDMPDCDPKLRNKIWICWWQGIDNAPEIVKTCVESIRRNAGKCEIIFITEDNYKDYVSFPGWVEVKRKAGIISRTIYSDLLRMNLLSNTAAFGSTPRSSASSLVLRNICDCPYGQSKGLAICIVPLPEAILLIIHWGAAMKTDGYLKLFSIPYAGIGKRMKSWSIIC